MHTIKSVLFCLLMTTCSIGFNQVVPPQTMTKKPIVTTINDGAYFLITTGNNDTLKRTSSATINSYILKKDTATILATQHYVLAHGGGTTTFNGQRPITGTSYPTGLNPNTTTINDFLEKVFYPSTSPTATINIGAYTLAREYTTAGSDPVTISWSVTRPLYCLALASTVVNGTTITPNPNPSEGGSVSNTQAGTVTRNSNKTFTNTVTTTDSKVGSASVSVAWYWKRYWGGTTSSSPNDLAIQALSNEFATTYVKSAVSINVAGKYLTIAYPASFGSCQIWVNGLNSTGSFTLTTRSYINASSGTTSYNIYVSNSTIGGTVSVEIK